MKLAARLFLVFFALMLLPTSSLKAQVPLPQHKSKNNQSAQTSRQVDEQLAYKFLNDKEYDKAADIYQQLYVNRGYYHYFSQYVECLILLEKLDVGTNMTELLWTHPLTEEDLMVKFGNLKIKSANF